MHIYSIRNRIRIVFIAYETGYGALDIFNVTDMQDQGDYSVKECIKRYDVGAILILS
jgi:hypothetical protein